MWMGVHHDKDATYTCCLHVHTHHPSHTLPHHHPRFPHRSLSNIGLYGTLPPEWGAAGAFPATRVVFLADNNLTGTLPTEWGGAAEDSWPQLQAMVLINNSLQGYVPSSWMSFGQLLTNVYVCWVCWVCVCWVGGVCVCWVCVCWVCSTFPPQHVRVLFHSLNLLLIIIMIIITTTSQVPQAGQPPTMWQHPRDQFPHHLQPLCPCQHHFHTHLQPPLRLLTTGLPRSGMCCGDTRPPAPATR